MRDALFTFVVVTVVSLTIWLFAEAESLGKESIAATVEVVSPEASRLMVYSSTAWDGRVTVDLSGSRTALQRAQELLEQRVKLPLASDAGEGERDVDLLRALQEWEPLARTGVTVESVRPLKAGVLVQEIVTRLASIRPELTGVEVQGAVAVAPEKAEVRLSRAAAARLADSLEVIARVPKDQAARLAQPGPVSVQAELSLPDSLAAERGASLVTTRASLAFSIRSTLTTAQFDAPVQVLTLPVEWGDWVVSIQEGDQQLKVQATGPSDAVDRLKQGEERVIAVLSLTSDDLARQITSKEVGFGIVRAGVLGGLPAGVEIKSDKRLVRFTVKKRGES